MILSLSIIVTKETESPQTTTPFGSRAESPKLLKLQKQLLLRKNLSHV